jgi:hypothetical protein
LKREIAAFLVAPILPSLFGLLVLLGIQKFRLFTDHSEITNLVGSAALIAAGSGVFSIPASALFGLPIFLVFRRFGWLGFRQILGGAALSGLIYVLAFSLYSQITSPNWYHFGEKKIFLNWSGFREGVTTIYLVIPIALLVGLAFWIIAYWRPNSGAGRKEAAVNQDKT